MSDQSDVYGRRDRVMVQQVEGSSVLLDIDSGEYFTLNEVGGRVWDLCDGSRSVASIAEALSAEYEVEEAVLRADAMECLGDLLNRHLVVLQT